jgi:ABC-type glycerol-3-phosphate transport system substrate-binding protein
VRLNLPLLIIFAALAAALTFSCGTGENQAAILWTDRSEFTFYAEQFNASQEKFKIEAHYLESPARALTGNGGNPDIVAASWLKSASTRSLFLPLDDLFRKETLSQNAFYPRLLALGSIDGKQYLLPVAFNIPALVFERNYTQSFSNPFTIGLEEIMERGKAYNTETGGFYTRMGFSPSWNDEFLYVIAALFNTEFRDASPLEWNTAALEEAVAYIRRWIAEANTGVQAEDDFMFKYLYDPPAKLLSSGRILFSYMDSSGFFTLPEERRTNLDFRWIAEKETIPLDESNVFFGIHKKTRAKKAALAFTGWFFQTETQRRLLESSKNKRLMETSFGIGGGFSAMRTVTEQVFPQFYPGLLGRMPPESALTPPNILPRNWMAMKERVILPFLHDSIRRSEQTELRPLERRISDWHRLNKE